MAEKRLLVSSFYFASLGLLNVEAEPVGLEWIKIPPKQAGSKFSNTIRPRHCSASVVIKPPSVSEEGVRKWEELM